MFHSLDATSPLFHHLKEYRDTWGLPVIYSSGNVMILELEHAGSFDIGEPISHLQLSKTHGERSSGRGENIKIA